jgi:hypothetical protein
MSTSTFSSMVSGWVVFGKASIDERQPADCTLTIHPNGSWCADLSTFTLAGDADLMFTSVQGGQFCGPATVLRSRADSDPLRAVTELLGTGPLLVAVPGDAELGSGTDVLDGEVVE